MAEPSRELLFSLDRVTARYGNRTACEDVSLSVASRDVYALLGGPGSGKTSVLRCAAGLERPASGRVELFGQDAWKKRRDLSRSLSFLPQEPDAQPSWTPRRILERLRRRRELRRVEPVRDLLTSLGVPPSAGAAQLSPRQRGAALLALAWKKAPRLLVVDDPSSSLEPDARAILLREIVSELVSRGSGVLLASREAGEIEAIATRVGFLQAGRLLLDEPLDRLKRRFRRLRYRSQITESRTDYGTELDSFDAVSVKVRGWGIDAIVSNYDDDSFARFRALDGVADAQALPLSLDEILRAVAQRARGRPSGGAP